MQYKKGFTLIEVLLVIAILAILASVVIIAINPAKQLRTARDAQRQSDVYSILNALHQYAVDNEGSFPDDLTSEEREICVTDADSCDDLYDLSELTDDERYLVSIPLDPLCLGPGLHCEQNGTGYHLLKSENGRITVSAYETEASDIDISITR